MKIRESVLFIFSVILTCANSTMQSSIRSVLAKLRMTRGNKIPFINALSFSQKIRPFKLKESVMCRAFGFTNGEGLFLQRLFNGNNLSNPFYMDFADLRVQIIPSTSPVDLRTDQGDACIGYVHPGEILSQHPLLVGNIHAYLEGALASNSTARLVMLVERSTSEVTARNTEKSLQSLVHAIAQATLSTRPQRLHHTPVPQVQLHIVRLSATRDPTGKATRKVLGGTLLNVLATHRTRHGHNPDMSPLLAPYVRVTSKAWNLLRCKLYPVKSSVIRLVSSGLTSSPSRDIVTIQDAHHLNRIEIVSFQLLRNISVALFDVYRSHTDGTATPSRSFIDIPTELHRLQSTLREVLYTAQLRVTQDIDRGTSRSPLGFALSPTELNTHLPSLPGALVSGLDGMLSSLFRTLLSRYEHSAPDRIAQHIRSFMNVTLSTPDVVVDAEAMSNLQLDLLGTIEKDLNTLSTGMAFIYFVGEP